MNKVHNIAIKQQKTSTKRSKSIKHWLVILSIGLPISLVCIPFSCCIRNPVAKVLDDHPSDPVYENMAVGCYSGVAMLSCCGCCLGLCGEFGPREL